MEQGQSLKIGSNDDQAAFSRFSRPTLDMSHPSASIIQNNPGQWLPHLGCDRIKRPGHGRCGAGLRRAGPFMSLSDFINRKLSDGEDGLMGPPATGDQRC